MAGLAALALSSNLTPALASPPVPTEEEAAEKGLQRVMFVGNNWDGTITVIDPSNGYFQIGRMNAIPDNDERMAEINADPIRKRVFAAIAAGPGEGNNQYVDDMYSNLEGTELIISRPSFADVISLSLETGEIVWRFPVSGFRSDHMAMSPDGKEVAVSSSTSNTVHLIDVETGEDAGSFLAGDAPHENHYFNDARYILNASIGSVSSANDAPEQDDTKGDRRFTIYDRETGEVARILDMRERLDAFGRTDLSDSIRPYAMHPDEKILFFQVSFFNGVIEYDFQTDRILRIFQLPDGAAPDDRTKFVNDSRHHGLSISRDGTKLCVAGTMDDYTTIIDVATGEFTEVKYAGKPYWATVSPDGEACVISESETDSVAVIDFETGEVLNRVDVGNHPQRVRNGFVKQNWKSPNPELSN
ncbi:MAG: serine/threonine protein kinase [Ponticaulis sp.]|nr:serine/threonine protein kinase [Ponticaulis sp.]